MGDIKRQSNKSERPSILWDAARLAEEKIIKAEYGLKNKQELWKFKSMLRKFRHQARSLIVRTEEKQGKKEADLLIKKLARLGLVESGVRLEDVLSLDLRKLLDRRLQTQVFKAGLARTAKQARQFVLHGHVVVNNKKVSVPSFLVSKEDKVSFIGTSSLAKEDHPERNIKRKEIVKITEKIEKPEEKKEEVKNAKI